MELESKTRLTKQVLLKGATRFGVALEQLTYIRAWQNFIYEYSNNGESYILRFTPSSHRCRKEVSAELNWILYLAQHNVSVSVPILSVQGKLTEEVFSGESFYFTVSAFIKAKGNKIGYPACLSDTKLYQQMGRITGKIHALSKHYDPKDEDYRRHSWENNYYLRSTSLFVPREQNLVHEQCRALIKVINETLPKDEHSYGLIHGDININNFLVHEKGITLFDFDEAQYSWFIEEITIPLYYFVYVYGDDSQERRVFQAHLFLDHFLQGYNLENHFDNDWLKHIPLFLRLREIIVYTGMHRSSDVRKLDQWGLDYIAQSKKRIENEIPIVNVWN